MRLLGLETEYGLYVEGKGPAEHLDEAAALVRAYAGAHVSGWDYRFEDPRRDARGFRVEQLAVDPADAQFDRPETSARPQAAVRSDRVLTNGARLYNDHGHPEYATPECLTPRELVAHDQAGERIVLACARARAERLGVPVRVYKNNTDFHGASYGTHENYLMERRVPFAQIVSGMLPFFVTRPLFAGAGKVGSEPGEGEALFQLSQRADFFTEEASVDTLYRRPIINTRDEAHADPAAYRRLHVICGDANLSPFATWLKVGTTARVVALIETGWQPPVRLRRPVETIRRLSRDQSLRWRVETDAGQTMAAVDVQRLYLEACQRLDTEDADDARVLSEWERVLDALERDPLSLGDRLDWVAKRQLLESYRAETGLGWEAAALRSLDLEYHNINPEEGLFHALAAEGHLRAVADEEEIARAMEWPPSRTRAAVRGACVRRFAPAVRAVTWTRLVLETPAGAVSLNLRDLVDGRAAALATAVERAASIEALAALASERNGGSDGSA